MTLFIILFLIFLGILLLLLEFVVIPGITLAGIGGVVLLGASIYLAFDTYGVLAGILTAAFVLIVSPMLVYRLFKGRTGKKMVLHSEITGRIDQIENISPGDEGITVGRLAPTGKVRISQQTIEGKAMTGFIDPKIPVRVVEVLKTQVIVEPIN